MKTKFVAPILLMASLTAFGNNAMSSDEFSGALLGAGTGAVLGNVVGGRDGAFVGGFIGALIGAAAADDRYPVARMPRREPYAPPPVMVYEAPMARYLQPVFVASPPQRWRHESDERHDGRGDHDRGGWRDDHAYRSGERWDRRGW
jgi:hypothetical protein